MQKWDRIKEEAFEAFRAFAMYRDNAEYRNLEILAKIFQCKVGKLSNWSAKFNWESRTENYETFLQSQVARSSAKEAKLSESIEKLLELLGDKLESSIADADKLKVDDIIKLLTTLNKALGEISGDKFKRKTESAELNKLIFTNPKAMDYLYMLIGEVDKELG